jgi:hypothetical protein
MGSFRALALASVIPWIPAVPPAPPVPPVAPPCTAASLESDFFVQGATGSLAGGVALTNEGVAACSLLGPVTVRFLDGSDPSGLMQYQLKPDPVDPGVPLPALGALQHGQSAFVAVWWSNWCGDSRPTRIGFTLPSGEELVFPLDKSSRCDAPSAPSTLGVGQPAPRAPQPLPASRLPLRAEIVETFRQGPKVIPGVRARRGGVARFRVALTNVSRRPFRFGRTCPTYEEGTGLDKPRELHVLNCRPVGVMAPGARVVFEMRVRVARDARLGRTSLTWELAPDTYLPPFAGGLLVVSR